MIGLGLIAAVLWPALSGSFIFDDYPIFVDNPIVHVNGWSWKAWHGVFVWAHANIQRPLAMASFALNYALGGDAWGFKATNLAIHLINVLLVALFAQSLLQAGWRSRNVDTVSGHLQPTKAWAWTLAVSTTT